MPIETLQARYDELLKSFAEMRSNYTKEIMHHKEGKISKYAHNSTPVNANFFDDLKYLTQQYILFQGSSQLNPDYLSQNAQIAINQKFQQVNLDYNERLEKLQAGSQKLHD